MSQTTSAGTGSAAGTASASGTAALSTGTLTVPSNVIGTISMYADETATINFDYVIPQGAITPPTPVQITEDSPSLASITTSGPQIGAFSSFYDVITITGNGVAGTEYLHAMEQGQDVSDIELVLNARPSISGTFDITTVVISETAVASTG